jgi:hypothetical protein
MFNIVEQTQQTVVFICHSTIVIAGLAVFEPTPRRGSRSPPTLRNRAYSFPESNHLAPAQQAYVVTREANQACRHHLGRAAVPT